MGEREHQRDREQPEPLFPLGQIVATPGALEAVEQASQQAEGQQPEELLISLLWRHNTGDWGQLDEEDKRENELSLQHGYRLLSAYELTTGAKVWVISEADRSATTFLLPSEY